MSPTAVAELVERTPRVAVAGPVFTLIPERLYNKADKDTYLDHLTERGIVNVEEPVSRPRREPPVWKLLVTMRQVLLDRGSPDPAQHFFVFQWRTKRNNYMQILMKKRPFSAEEIARRRRRKP